MIGWREILAEQEHRGITPIWGSSRECHIRSYLINMIAHLARVGWNGKVAGEVAIADADRAVQKTVGCFYTPKLEKAGPPYNTCHECPEYRPQPKKEDPNE